MDHSGHHGHHGHGTPSTTTPAPMMAHVHDHHDHLAASAAPESTPQGLEDMCAHMSSGHHMMSMTFHFGYCEDVLFDGWQIRSVGTLIGSMLGIFIMAALYEGLKYYREYLFWRSNNSIQYRSVTPPQNGASEDSSKSVVAMVPEIIHHQPPSMLSGIHALQTALHVLQIVLSYFLMLIFMTYNVWLCLAIVTGAALGYFLFGWKKSVIVDVTEHCH